MNISVVIPTFGRDQILVATIQSLLDLDDSSDEILVIDQTHDHDTNTESFLREANDHKRIRWIRHQPPGHVGALNRGLAEARGDIVLFLDDDISPSEKLVSAHRLAYERHPQAWAVVGQVLQPGEEPDHGPYPALRHRKSFLRRDLDFRFNRSEPAWVENVITCNLSVRREQALSLGGFDEGFVPPVSYRAETELAKRLIAAGGKIRFEPEAGLRHLRVARGGTRSKGGHMASGSPLHGVGDYYFALKHGKGWDRFAYMARRPFREVCTKFHLRHPWWIPVKFVGELRAMWMAFRLFGRSGKEPTQTPKQFYDTQYTGERYAAYSSPAGHSFGESLREIIGRYGIASGRWLEVGCGRGLLQDVVVDYTGVDIAETAATYFHKPFHCAPAETLPFPDARFDGIWSYAVLEHVMDPERSIDEMRRVLTPGGILILAPAWQCRPWAGRDYAWKPYSELCLKDCFLKTLIPLRDSVVFRLVFIMPRRILRLLTYGILRKPMRFRCRSLTPCYEAYHVADSDARHSMDPFEAILWFRSRGDRVLSHPGWRQSFLVRTGTLVIEMGDR